MTNKLIQNERREEASATCATPAPGTSAQASTAQRTQGRPDQGAAADPASSLTDIQSFEIKCLASALYHEDRERFFAWTHRAAMFLVVASGTAALSPLKETYPVGIPAFITLIGLLDLVFDLSGKARLHATLRKQIYAILADVGHDDLKDLERRLTLVYAEEPPCMHAVNALAYNQAMRSYGRPDEFQLVIGWRETMLRHLWPFTPASFVKCLAD